MKWLMRFGLVICALLVAPAASAQFHEETLQLSVSDTSDDQFTSVIYKPLWAKGVIIVLEVTDASGALSTDIDILINSPALGAAHTHTANCPSGITGDSVNMCAIVSMGVYTMYTISEKVIQMPQQFIIKIDETGAETASYNLYTQWIH